MVSRDVRNAIYIVIVASYASNTVIFIRHPNHPKLVYRVPEIDERLVPAIISPPATVGLMKFYRGPAPGHLPVSGGHMIPRDP